MAASLDSKFGEKTQITPGKSGQFDVLVDGRVIFSKANAGRFPIDGEVEEIFAAMKEGREPRPVEEKRPEGFISRALGKLRN